MVDVEGVGGWGIGSSPLSDVRVIRAALADCCGVRPRGVKLCRGPMGWGLVYVAALLRVCHCWRCCRVKGLSGGTGRRYFEAQRAFLLVFLLVCFGLSLSTSSAHAGLWLKFVFRRSCRGVSAGLLFLARCLRPGGGTRCPGGVAESALRGEAMVECWKCVTLQEHRPAMDI